MGFPELCQREKGGVRSVLSFCLVLAEGIWLHQKQKQEEERAVQGQAEKAGIPRVVGLFFDAGWAGRNSSRAQMDTPCVIPLPHFRGGPFGCSALRAQPKGMEGLDTKKAGGRSTILQKIYGHAKA